MSKFLSSIFSFKTIKIKTIPAAWWYTLLVTLIILIFFELGARKLMDPLGDYSWTYWNKDAMHKFEWYRERSLQGNTPEIIAVGDSTGARNFSPQDFIKEAGMANAYNLAWPGNFPMSLRVSTFPLLEKGIPPKYVLLFLSPDSYVDNPDVIRFEEGILSSTLGRKHAGIHLTSDYIYLSRIYTARFLLIQHWIYHRKLKSTPVNMGFMPLYTDSNDGTNSFGLNTHEEKQLSPDRLKIIIELSTISRKRNFQLIVMISPTPIRPIPVTFFHYKKWLNENSVAEGYKVLDYSDSPFLGSEYFKDSMHLNNEGAKLFSSKLGNDFRSLFMR